VTSRAALLATASAAVLLACAGLGGVRPRYGPVPGSIAVEMRGAPDVITLGAAEELRSAGLLPQRVSAAEGYVESRWYDVSTHASSAQPPFRGLDRVVKLRFFADPTAGHTHLAAEAVVTYAVDPSRPERELERMVPEGHEGLVILRRILDRLQERFPSPADTTKARGDSVRSE
jgi:hypothetical protein